MFGRSRLAKLAHRRAAVHTIDGKSIAGLIVAVYPDALAIRHARLLDAPAIVPLDGEVVIPLGNVSFIQDGLELDDTKALER